MSDPAFEAVRSSAIFCGLREDDIEKLVAGARRRSVEPGTCLIEEGDSGDSLLVIISGEVEVVRVTGDSEASLARFGPGSFVGEMALIDQGPRTATVRALRDSEILEITKEQFDSLLDRSPDACRTLIRTILRRLKSTEAMLVNQEKLAALGRVSAGMAHELNNPASAVSRFASQLASTVDEWRQTTIRLTESPALERIGEAVSHHRASMGRRGETRVRSALEQADDEDRLVDWMEQFRIENPWDAAANMASAGWTPDQLAALNDIFEETNAADVIDWLSAESSIQVTLSEMRTSAERLSEIVDAIKRYSHMDRAPVERFDINRGLESTLVILRHKLRDIDVQLDLDPELPMVEGYPAEMNQVWTNLVDNAADAMKGKGTLRIKTSRSENQIKVTLTDSGSGIPQEYQNRLFEPFFTTKDVGIGTGLGLHISHNIIVQRHGGQIGVESQPGKTTFTVTLPLTRE